MFKSARASWAWLYGNEKKMMSWPKPKQQSTLVEKCIYLSIYLTK